MKKQYLSNSVREAQDDCQREMLKVVKCIHIYLRIPVGAEGENRAATGLKCNSYG